MTTVTVNPAQAEALKVTGELVQICDETGAVLGFFAPLKMEYVKEYAEMAARSYSLWGPDGPPRRSMTTDEVLAHLQSLERKL